MRIRQRVEQHAIDDGKKRRVRADAERESEDGDGGEAGRFEEHPDGITKSCHSVVIDPFYSQVGVEVTVARGGTGIISYPLF